MVTIMAILMVFLVVGSPDYKHCGKPETAVFFPKKPETAGFSKS